MTIERAIIATAIRRWMAGLPLTDRDRSIVEAVLQINAADQFIRCSEGYSHA